MSMRRTFFFERTSNSFRVSMETASRFSTFLTTLLQDGMAESDLLARVTFRSIFSTQILAIASSSFAVTFFRPFVLFLFFSFLFRRSSSYDYCHEVSSFSNLSP
jgi:hypothetical protein